MAVAIWDHAPTAAELLAHRLARGWQPTPTATRDGDVILGYAACARPAQPPPVITTSPQSTRSEASSS